MAITMKSPCENCPFRSDLRPPFFLRRSRAEEIAESLRRGESFHCHKTVNYDDAWDGKITETSLLCAGALLVLDAESSMFASQMLRIAARLGRFDPDEDIDHASAQVFGDLDEFVDEVGRL